MRRLAAIPLIHQPGEGWTYNLSYDVLGVLLARAAGQVARRSSCASGARSARHGRHRLPRAGGLAATASPPCIWRTDGGDLEVSDPPDGAFARQPAFPSGAGGLVTTVDDQLAFGRMLLAGGGDGCSARSRCG